jgi:hypothetical protein
MGRPSDYDLKTAALLCERIVEGQSLRSICLADDMPSIATVFRWIGAHEEFREQYAKARDAQADTLADELLDIADDGSNDWIEKFGKDGKSIGWQFNAEAAARSRLRVDTRKWIASKLKPKVYSDKLDVNANIEAKTETLMRVEFVAATDGR